MAFWLSSLLPSVHPQLQTFMQEPQIQPVQAQTPKAELVFRGHIKTLNPTSHFMLSLFTAPSSFIVNINQTIEQEGHPVHTFARWWSVLLLSPSQQMFYLLSYAPSDRGSCPPEANYFHSQIPLQLQSLTQCQL